MSIKKQYSKKDPICKVTFTLTEEAIGTAEHAALAGNFNWWDTYNLPMKRTKNGAFEIKLDLDKGKEYQFRYLVDGKRWINDPEADGYIPNHVSGEDNCLIKV